MLNFNDAFSLDITILRYYDMRFQYYRKNIAKYKVFLAGIRSVRRESEDAEERSP